MTPTHGNEKIEGRSYKDYAYSPVPVSSPSAVCGTPPVRESVELNIRDRTSLRTVGHCCPENMTEKGSKYVQFLAAAAGKCPFANKGLNPKEEVTIKLIHCRNSVFFLGVSDFSKSSSQICIFFFSK